MDNKYQTKAKRAEDHVYAQLMQEKGILKPWSLVSCSPNVRTLQTTADEVPMIFMNQAYIRPGYEVIGNMVTVPCLFTKVSGINESFSIFDDAAILNKHEGCIVYTSISAFHQINGEHADIFELLEENNQIDRAKLLSKGFFKFQILRQEYQKIYMDTIDEIIANRDMYFTNMARNITPAEILSSLLYVDEPLLHSYNAFDFQFQPPSVIISNTNQENFTAYQAACLLFLHKLGFDVVIITKSGFSDIENVLSRDLYTIFYSEKLSALNTKPKKVNRRRLSITIISASLLLTAVVLSININAIIINMGRSSQTNSVLPTSTPVITAQPTSTPVITAQPTSTPVITAQPTSTPVITTQPTSTPVIAVQPTSTPAGTVQPTSEVKQNPLVIIGETNITDTKIIINFSSPEMEAAIRKIIDIPSGVIQLEDINKINTLSFIGPYSGKEDWIFINGYYYNFYEDASRQRHTEEGSFRNLSDLRQFPNLFNITLNWQKEVELESIKKLDIYSLSILHDHITDLGDMSSLKNLITLDISYNEIEDISGISNLINLQRLNASCNSLKDIKVLEKLINLSELELNDNPYLSDFTPIEKCTNLKALYAGHTSVNNFNFLSKLPNLRYIYLDQTGLSDLTVFKSQTEIVSLMIANNPISDISYLKNFKYLRTLDISYSNVKDFSVLKELPNLKQVFLYGLSVDEKSLRETLKNVEIFK